MARFRVSLLAALLLLSAVLVAALPGPGDAQTVNHLVISEVMYDPPQSGADTDYEWVEIFNPTSAAVNLIGWKLRDNTSDDALPQFVLAPGGYLIVAATTSGFTTNNPGFMGQLVSLEGSIGNGLGNTADRVLLIAPDGTTTVDAMSYGGDVGGFNPSCPNAPVGGSLARVPSTQDTDNAADWAVQASPSPGGAGIPPIPTPTATNTRTQTPTRTPTATFTATATPSKAFSGAVIITEIMQNPKAVDDTQGEWFELYNATGGGIDLNGWIIRDLGGDSHRIGAGSSLWLPAHGYLVLGRNTNQATNGGAPVAYRYTSFTLGNSDDEIILEDAAGTEIDRVVYGPALGFPSPDGASIALIDPQRDNAGGSNWRASFTAWPGSAGDLGSPGAANPIPPAQIEGHVFEDRNSNRHRDRDEVGIEGVWLTLNTGARTHTDRNGWYGFYGLAARTYVVTESQPDGYISTMPDQLTITVAPAEISLGHDFGELRLPTPTPSPSPTGAPAAQPKLLLSEVFYDAPQTGTDSDYEWVEIFNPTTAAVDLAGWKLRDNTMEDVIPQFVLAPGEYVIIAATATGFAANTPGFTGHLVSLEGSIGGGLGNTDDRVLLIAPDGTTVDAMSYGGDIGGFNPSCPNAPVGGSLARISLAQDTDTAADWTVQHTPNPGVGVAAPTPTATRTPTPTSIATLLWSPTPSATGLPTQTPTPSPISTGAAHAALRLNEVLPCPDQIDWNGDGKVDSGDEWVEIVSLETAAIDLGGRPGTTSPVAAASRTRFRPARCCCRAASYFDSAPRPGWPLTTTATRCVARAG